MTLDSEDIIYIKFSCKDIDGNDCFIKASVKEYNEREILACAKFDESLRLVSPQDISLNIICQNGVYKTDSVIRFVEKAEPYLFFTIEILNEMQFMQNREYFRVKLSTEVIMISNNISYNCHIYDISASGIKLVLPKDINISDNVLLDILFAPKNIKTKAKFIRKTLEKNVITASFHFVNLMNSDLDTISKICIQKQLQDKKNSLM